MREYFESLGSSEKARDVAKLEVVGLMLEDDPCAKESATKFSTDMTGWPPVEDGHIFPTSLRGLESRLSNSSCAGSNRKATIISRVTTLELFTSGSREDRLYILRATVNPSQRTPDKANHAWILVKLTGHWPFNQKLKFNRHDINSSIKVIGNSRFSEIFKKQVQK